MEIDSEAKSRLHDTEISLMTDDFTKKKSITFTRIGGINFNYLRLFSEGSTYAYPSLGITFENNDGFVYIKFISTSDNLPLAKNDDIIFLFEDDVIIKYVFSFKASGSKHRHVNVCELTTDHIKIFCSNNLKKIKLTGYRHGVYEIFHFQKTFTYRQFINESEGQYLFRFMMALFIKFHLDNNVMLTIN